MKQLHGISAAKGMTEWAENELVLPSKASESAEAEHADSKEGGARRRSARSSEEDSGAAAIAAESDD